MGVKFSNFIQGENLFVGEAAAEHLNNLEEHEKQINLIKFRRKCQPHPNASGRLRCSLRDSKIQLTVKVSIVKTLFCFVNYR